MSRNNLFKSLFYSMNYSQELETLRREHLAAVDDFDFKLAQDLSIRIKKLEQGLKKSSSKSNIEFLETSRKIHSLADYETHQYETDRLEIEDRYNERINHLLDQQRQQLIDLENSYQLNKQRELNRPVYEVELKKNQSKKFGINHDYYMANALYQEASRIEKNYRDKRLNDCYELYIRQKIKLEKKHKKEISFLEEKRKLELQELEQNHEREQNRFENSQIVAKVRSSLYTREFPKVTRYMKPSKRSISSLTM